MENWTPMEWSAFFMALGTFVSAVLSAIAAFYAALAKIRGETNSKKIDENTRITVAGNTTAATNAKSAEIAATAAAKKADAISDKLNGDMDTRMHAIVQEHLGPVVCDIKEIKQTLATMKGVVPQETVDTPKPSEITH